MLAAVAVLVVVIQSWWCFQTYAWDVQQPTMTVIRHQSIRFEP